MKILAALLICFAGISSAQDFKAEEQENQKDKKRLESVTWDLKSHKLMWVVQRGKVENGKFTTVSKDTYEITPDDAVMAFSDERRGFTKEEAKSLHQLLDTLSLYCAESVVWWDQGQGIKLGPDSGKPKGERVKDETPRPDVRLALLAAAIPRP